MLYGLDVCAGSGIGSAAFEALGFCRTVCYVERDAYCQRLLRQRMQDGWLAPAPIWDDLRTFDGRPWRGLVDFVFGGIPCQPHSLAGKREGGADERDLWPDFWRVVREVGPRVVLVENVPGLLSSDGGRFMGRILGDLASGGYDAEWDCIPAAAVGAPHRRDRVWLVAYADGRRREECHGQRQTVALHQSDADSEAELADTRSRGQSAVRRPQGDSRQPDECGPSLADAMCCGRAGWAHEQGQQAPRRVWASEDRQTVADAQVQPIRPGLCESEQAGQWRRRPCDGGGEGAVPDTIGPRLAQRQGLAGDDGAQQPTAERGGDGAGRWWGAESCLDRGPHGMAGGLDESGTSAWADGWEDGLPRVAAGVPNRVDRLRTIGNGWVPQVAAVVAGRIGRRLLR